MARFFDDPANQPPGGDGGTPQPGGPQMIIAWYQHYLGRMPTQEEIQTHLGNPGGAQGAQQTIMNSPEAQAYALAHPGGAATPPPTGSGTGPGTAGTGGFTKPQGDFTDPAVRRAAIIQGYKAAYPNRGEPSDSIIQYWDGLFQKDPDYAWDRLLGKGAGGSDMAEAGPYAGGKGYSSQGGGPPLGTGSFAGWGGGDPAGFGAPPPPYQSEPSNVPAYQTPPRPANLQQPYAPPSLPGNLQTPFAPNALPRNLQNPYILPAYNQAPAQPAPPPQSAMVLMREPGGTTMQVPAEHVAHYTQAGAQVVQQGGQ